MQLEDFKSVRDELVRRIKLQEGKDSLEVSQLEYDVILRYVKRCDDAFYPRTEDIPLVAKFLGRTLKVV